MLMDTTEPVLSGNFIFQLMSTSD